jgi:hypothetical protein
MTIESCLAQNPTNNQRVQIGFLTNRHLIEPAGPHTLTATNEVMYAFDVARFHLGARPGRQRTNGAQLVPQSGNDEGRDRSVPPFALRRHVTLLTFCVETTDTPQRIH